MESLSDVQHGVMDMGVCQPGKHANKESILQLESAVVYSWAKELLCAKKGKCENVVS